MNTITKIKQYWNDGLLTHAEVLEYSKELGYTVRYINHKLVWFKKG